MTALVSARPNPADVATRPRKEQASPCVACLYCEATDYDLLYDGIRDRLGFVPGKWTLWRCRRCGSASLLPPPGAEQIAGFYPPTYTFAPELGQRGTLRRLLAWLEYRLFFGPQYGAQARLVARETGWGTKQRLLDLGCGRGLRLLSLRALGYEVHGLDFQAEDVKYLREVHKIEASCGDAARADTYFTPASFDVVTAFNLLEHVPDVEGVIRAAYHVLRPGGWLVAAVPLADSVQAGLLGRRWATVTEVPRHFSIPTRAGMEAVCRSAGFTDVRLRPDATFNCAGLLALSLLPGASITHCYGGGRLRALALRLVGALATVAALPWCWLENRVARRPANGVFFARKPREEKPCAC